jgi:hypothetical protein
MNKELNLRTDEKMEVLKQTSINKTREYIGTLRPQRGHTLFQFNQKTKELTKADFSVDKEIDFNDAVKGLTSQNKQVDGQEGMLYISALNKRNAIKKIFKGLKN